MKRKLMACGIMVVALPVFAKIEMGTPFADGGVLQRDKPVPVWGTADAGSEVAVSFAGQTKTAVADANGAWRITLDPMSASKESRDLTVVEMKNKSQTTSSTQTTQTIQQSNNQTILHDILVGEVWFASGQSNMDCPIWGDCNRYRDGNGALVAQMANLPYVRWFKNPRSWSVDKLAIKARWNKLVKADLIRNRCSFSAVAFYYARELYLALDIPIGIVDSSVGGTNIDAWTPRIGYADCDASIRDTADYVVKDAKTWNAATDKVGPIHNVNQQPTVLFNGSVAAWAPMAMRGFIWYQGCHNAGSTERARYCAKLHALYNGWSREFRNPDLKLYLVQLAPYHSNWNEIVAQQNRFVAEEKNAAIAVTSDVGNFLDIHPNQKEIVAKRLAVHALKRDYGFDIDEDDSPTVRSVTYADGQAELVFDHAKAFYNYAFPDRFGEPPFELAGTNGVWETARIANYIMATNHSNGAVYSTGNVQPGNRIVLKSAKVADPVRVRYMGQPKTAGSLYNEASLPLGPFEK